MVENFPMLEGEDDFYELFCRDWSRIHERICSLWSFQCRAGEDRSIMNRTEELGRMMAKRGHGLVFGGGATRNDGSSSERRRF